jgi:hypothetical protein
MAKPSRATQEKRNRERSKKERQEDKQADRLLRKENRKDRAEMLKDGIDPDLVGIVPGPQPQME